MICGRTSFSPEDEKEYSQPKKNLLLIKRHDLIYMEYKGDYLLTSFAKKPIFLHNLLELNEELLSI